MSKQRLWNTEWKRIKRKSNQNIDMLAQEEYFQYIAERSAYYDVKKTHCNEEQNKNEDQAIDITFNNDFISNNDFGHDYKSNDQFITQKDNETQSSYIESTNSLKMYVPSDEKRNTYEIENFFSNNVNASTSDETLHEYKINVKEINQESLNFDFKLIKDLRVWALKRNITLNALSHLLKILKKYDHKLPVCAQTLLKTPRNTILLIKELEDGGQFWYNGILSGLKTVLSTEILKTMSNVIEIDVFFDGFSPYHSIWRCLWPIAGCIVGKKEVFIIAIWCGETKCPSNLDTYLEDFINESLELMNGFYIEEKYYKLKIRNIIADAPARAWLKCVNQHDNKFSCERCTIKGVWFGNRMTYPPHEEAPLRTNESFCKQTQKEYHKGTSSLITRLQLKPLTQFPLESFHLLYLGIMKRILSKLYCVKASKYKLPCDIVCEIDNSSYFLKSFFPSDFARKPRRLSDWKYYKGTEFRRLLLYDGFLIFRFMPREVYTNFLLFACAVRILVDPVLVKDYAVDADKLLKLFVKHSSKIYGQRLCSV